MREPCIHCGQRHFASDENCPVSQLAAEAWGKIVAYDGNIIGKQTPEIESMAVSEIKSAIKKATCDLQLVVQDREETIRLYGKTITKLEQSRAAHASESDLEWGGKLVRNTWIAWAKEQPNPKPSWLVPWEELSEPDKEVDRRIYAACRGGSCICNEGFGMNLSCPVHNVTK